MQFILLGYLRESAAAKNTAKTATKFKQIDSAGN
jgi:hypothetical protein